MTEDIVIRTTVVGADALAAALTGASVEVAKFTLSTTRKHGALLLTQTRARASGRPGPRAQTGDYRRSITLTERILPGQIVETVGTNSPQARRLEFGFAPGIAPQGGVDVLGRHFQQQPLPHFGPAFDLVSAQYQAEMSRGVTAIVAAIRGRGI